MSLEQRRVLKQITIVAESRHVHVQWADQILKDGAVIAETFFRRAYKEADASDFVSEVENASAYMTALGWTVPQT